MIVAIIFAHVWGVLQLMVLGIFASTARARTVLVGIAVGLYACAPVALLLQRVSYGFVAWLLGTSAYDVHNVSMYTSDPFIEEIVKVLPLAVLLMVPVIRQQWSITDCILVGAAIGSGFGLAEDLYRLGAASHKALATDSGWIVGTDVSLPQVPGVGVILRSWLPPGSAPGEIFSPGVDGRPWVNLHLAWSAIGGLAVALVTLRRGAVRWAVGTALFFYVCFDHAAWNAATAYDSWMRDFVAPPFDLVRRGLPLLPIAALLAAGWLDRRQQRPSGSADALLAAEQSASLRPIGTLRAASSRLPWSLTRVFAFVQLRRAYHTDRARGQFGEANRLQAVIVATRDRLERFLADRDGESTSSLRRSWTSSGMAAWLRRPSSVIWIVLVAPSLLWFVVGGWPETAWVQRALTTGAPWMLVLALSTAAQLWLIWQIAIGLRVWSRVVRFPVGDAAATHGLRIMCAVGAVGFTGHALMRVLSGREAFGLMVDLPNVSSAANDSSLGNAVNVGGTAVIMSPADTPASWPGERPVPYSGSPDLPLEDANWIIDVAAGGIKGGVEVGTGAALERVALHKAGKEGVKSALGTGSALKSVGKHEAVETAAEKALHWVGEHVPPLTVPEGNYGLDEGSPDPADAGVLQSIEGGAAPGAGATPERSEPAKDE